MPRDLHLGIRLTADGKGLVGEVRVAQKELDRLAGTTRKADGTTRRYSQAAGEAERATRRTGRGFLAAHGHIVKYLGVLGGAGGATKLFRGTSPPQVRILTDSGI